MIIVEWLEDLLRQKQNGVPIHHIQSFQVVNTPQHSNTTYMAIVLCQHTDLPPSQDEATIEHLLKGENLGIPHLEARRNR